MRKMIIKYFLALMPISLLLGLFVALEANIVLYLPILGTGIATTAFVLNDIIYLYSIKKQNLKYFFHIIIFVSQVILFIIIAAITGGGYLIETMGGNIIFTTSSVILIRIAKDVANKRAEVGCLIAVPILFLIVFIIVNNIFFIRAILA